MSGDLVEDSELFEVGGAYSERFVASVNSPRSGTCIRAWTSAGDS